MSLDAQGNATLGDPAGDGRIHPCVSDAKVQICCVANSDLPRHL